MRCKINSYATKNASAPGTKAKKLKADSSKFNNEKKIIGVKDNRKFKNDKMLSEAEKVARRMDLENMKNKLKNYNVKNDQIFKDIETEKDWTSDSMALKMKQLGKLDEGLNDSSDDDDDDNDGKEESSKYFAQGTTSLKQKKKTLEDMIRESKVKKLEKKMANEKDVELMKKVNTMYKDEARHIMQQTAATLKSKKNSDKSLLNYKTDFNNVFKILSFAEKPVQVKPQILGFENSEKKNEKLVNNKVDRLREHLKKSGIIKDNETDELNVSDLDSESEENDSDNEDTAEEEETEDDDDISDEDLAESDNDNSDIDSSSEADKKDVTSLTISELKSSIAESKCTKRKLTVTDENDAKKPKIECDKNEIDCLRVLLEMDLKNEVMLVIASELDCGDVDRENIVRKLVLAALLHDALKTYVPNNYSPELVRFLRSVVAKSVRNSGHWLCVESDVCAMERDQLLNMCTAECDSALLATSIIYHVLRMTNAVLSCQTKLPSVQSLFVPFQTLIGQLPIEFYPNWIKEEIETLSKQIVHIESLPVATMVVKRQYKIVELLEPDLDDKFDPKKDVTKMLKKKVKIEKKALKKDVRLAAQCRVMREVTEGRKAAAIRDRKTLAIINNISQT